MTRFEFETYGMDAALAYFVRTPPRVLSNMRSAVEVTARNVKDTAGENVRAIPQRVGPKGGRLKPLSHAFNYPKVTVENNAAETRVKANGKQARLIGPIENGTPHTAPKKPLKRAADANRADFIRGIEKAVEDGTS